MSRISVRSVPVAIYFCRALGATFHLFLWGGAAFLCWRSRFACQGSFLTGLALLFCFLVVSSLAYFLRELNFSQERSQKESLKAVPLERDRILSFSTPDFVARHWGTILPVVFAGFLFFPLFHWRAIFLFLLLIVGEILCCRKIPSVVDLFFQKGALLASSMTDGTILSGGSSDSFVSDSCPAVHSTELIQDLVMESMDEEEECEEKIEPNLLFSQTRRKTSRGRESLEGWVRPHFDPFQEVGVVYLPFTPAFRAVPTLDLFLLEGDVKLTVTQIEPFGARIEVKRTVSRNEEDEAENIVVGDFCNDSIRFGFFVEGEIL